MSSSVNCSVIRESSNRLLTALKRKFKDLDTRNIFLILKIAYILSLLSFVVIEGFDESGSECLIMIVLLWTCKDCRSGCPIKLCATFDVNLSNFYVSGASSSSLSWTFCRAKHPGVWLLFQISLHLFKIKESRDLLKMNFENNLPKVIFGQNMTKWSWMDRRQPYFLSVKIVHN